MMKISRISIFAHKSKNFNLFRRFNDFKNKPNITKTLQELKEFSAENLSKLKTLFNSEKKIHIFQIISLTKFLFIGTRLQVLAYSIGTLSYGFYALYFKYYKLYYYKKTERARIMRIKIIASFILVLLSSTFGLMITSWMGKRIIKSIYYLPADKIFEINYFSLLCFNKTLRVPLENIKKLEKKRRFDSTIEYEITGFKKYNLLSTKGTGLWINKKLIEVLIKGI